MNKEKAVFLCYLDDIDDPGAKGFCVETAGRRQEIFVVRRNNHIYGYRNQCPHTGVCLDWQPDAFLSEAQTHIVCSMHGALFRMDDGFCVAGPCRGDTLPPADTTVIDKSIYLLPS